MNLRELGPMFTRTELKERQFKGMVGREGGREGVLWCQSFSIRLQRENQLDAGEDRISQRMRWN